MPAETTPPTDPGLRPLRCAVGLSTDGRIDIAIRAAADEAGRSLAGPADLAVVFVSAAYGDAIRPAMEGLAEVVRATAVIGATAEGVLAGDTEYESGPAVSVWLARLPGADIVPLSLEYSQTPDGGMFVGWPAQLADGWPDGASLLLLADPFSFPVDALIRRMEEDHPGVPILGGMASGGYEPGSNTLVVGSRSYDSGAVGVVVGGGVRIRPVVSQGCRPIGRPLVITKAEENVIVELGGRPALERLREVYGDLGPADRELVKSSLHVGRVASEYQDHFQRGDFLVRNVVGADPESGVIFDTPCLDAACLQECLGPVPAAGFFAQGEIGPIGDRNCLHGFTASIALFEAAAGR